MQVEVSKGKLLLLHSFDMGLLLAETCVVSQGRSGLHFLRGLTANDSRLGTVWKSQYCFSFPSFLCPPLTRAKGKISWFSLSFVFWFCYPWNQDSSEENSVREALQQFISNYEGIRRNRAPVSLLPLSLTPLQPEVPLETHRSDHPSSPDHSEGLLIVSLASNSTR